MSSRAADRNTNKSIVELKSSIRNIKSTRTQYERKRDVLMEEVKLVAKKEDRDTLVMLMEQYIDAKKTVKQCLKKETQTLRLISKLEGIKLAQQQARSMSTAARSMDIAARSMNPARLQEHMVSAQRAEMKIESITDQMDNMLELDDESQQEVSDILGELSQILGLEVAQRLMSPPMTVPVSTTTTAESLPSVPLTKPMMKAIHDEGKIDDDD
jgi:hypothetical protein